MAIKIKVFTAFILIIYIVDTYAQDTINVNKIILAKKPDSINVITSSLYYELGGNALYQSVNYEKMICTNGNYKLAFRLSFGFNSRDDAKDIYFPMELNYYRGKIHNWEVGIGFIPLTANLKEFDKALNVRSTQAVTSVRAGYRYISKNQKLMVRIGILALWRSNFSEPHQKNIFFYEKRDYYSSASIWNGIKENIIPWLGVSVGYNFTEMRLFK